MDNKTNPHHLEQTSSFFLVFSPPLEQPGRQTLPACSSDLSPREPIQEPHRQIGVAGFEGQDQAHLLVDASDLKTKPTPLWACSIIGGYSDANKWELGKSCWFRANASWFCLVLSGCKGSMPGQTFVCVFPAWFRSMPMPSHLSFCLKWIGSMHIHTQRHTDCF